MYGITKMSSLRDTGIDPAGPRVNVVLDDIAPAALRSGLLIEADDVRPRVTMACEPCAYGAGLAGAPVRKLRNLVRVLATVVDPGVLAVGHRASLRPLFEESPDNFGSRCAWMLDRIPAGEFVTSVEFLRAIGASSSYARVLPRWLGQARRHGEPAHRVLAASLTAPSWAPDALEKLAAEGTSPTTGEPFALTRAVWFDSHAYAAR